MLLPCTGDAVRGGTSNGFQPFDFLKPGKKDAFYEHLTRGTGRPPLNG